MLDGKLVYAIADLIDWEGNVIAESGTEFVWNDSTTDQTVDGQLVFVAEWEVELVENQS